jgi:hypothetical protein
MPMNKVERFILFSVPLPIEQEVTKNSTASINAVKIFMFFMARPLMPFLFS